VFSRYIAREFILVVMNIPMSTFEPFSAQQTASSLLIWVSAALAIHAVKLQRAIGLPSQARANAELFGFEKTSQTVTAVAYRFIRAPWMRRCCSRPAARISRTSRLPAAG
jgi:hypothetical protein